MSNLNMKIQNIEDAVKFIDNLEIEEEIVIKNNNELKLNVTYRWNKDIEIKTNDLFYKRIDDNLDNINIDKCKILKKYFENEEIFWLDIDKHPWPNESDYVDVEQIKRETFKDYDNNNDVKEFADKLYEAIEEIRREHRSQYGQNLVTNNHWHDIVKLFQFFIRENLNFTDDKKKIINSGISDDEKKNLFNLFSRLVYRWNNGRLPLFSSNECNTGDRKLIHDMYSEIKNTDYVKKNDRRSKKFIRQI
ncbi:MAG: hypothetical protein Fur0023_05590 [Bacteroidia bacterium]